MNKESDVELQVVRVDLQANTPHDDSASSYPDVPMWKQLKRGGKWCGCCCDYRRAVIILAMIRLITNVINIPVLMAAPDQTAPSTSSGVEDGEEGQEVFSGSMGNPAFLMSMAIFTAIASLVGALKFNIQLVAIDLVWFVVIFIWSTIFYCNNIGDVIIRSALIVNLAIFTPLFMSPGIGFIMEVRNGTMSRETYPREEYSCCCTSPPRRNALAEPIDDDVPIFRDIN